MHITENIVKKHFYGFDLGTLSGDSPSHHQGHYYSEDMIYVSRKGLNTKVNILEGDFRSGAIRLLFDGFRGRKHL